MSNTHQIPYQVGGTQIIVGASMIVSYTPAQGQNAFLLKYGSGGTLFIVDGPSAVITQGYAMGTTEAVAIGGPAKFFLGAMGATTVCMMVRTYSYDPSLLP